ncbi:MAG: hypothetical protein ACJA02_001070 [Myxococcota bacterium]|jgi:hypothetical protein
MKNLKKTLLITASAVFLFGANAQAEENLWVYTKGSDTRPQGSFEFKLSDTIRVGKDSGDYVFHDIRPEIEYGITDSLTIGAEIMFFDHNYSINSDNNPTKETQDANGGKVNQTRYGGYELSLKYNVLSPYKDFMGLSFGLGFEDRDRYRLDGAQIDQQSYVGTIFAQKNWIDNRLTLAVNLKTELERRKSGADSVLEEEIAFDFSAGIAYRFIPKHFIGLEVRTQSDYLNPSENGEKDTDHQSSNWDLTDISLGNRHQYAWYAGPTYHYAQKNWWATVGVLFQVAGGGSKNAFVENNKNYDEHEDMHIGLTYGYEF